MSSNPLLSIKSIKESLHKFREKILKLRKMCESPNLNQNQAMEILEDGLIDIIDIKKMNYIIQNDTEISKEECLIQQHKAEEQNLNYQNFLYQKENTINQINLCDSFQTPEIDKIYPDKKEKITFEKLNNELLQRKRLYDKYIKFNEEKENNLINYREQENYIKSIPQYLSNIEVSTLKAQKLLNINITEKIFHNHLSQKLPQSLFVLFNMFKNYSGNENIKINIKGNENEIFNFYREYPNENKFILNINESKEDGEQSDDGENLQNLLIDNNNNIINDKKENISSFPLFLELEINFTIKIIFKFYPIVKIVTVELKSNSNNFNTENILSNLFDYKENYIISNNKNKKEEDINNILKTLCKNFNKNELFYEYIQILSNNSSYNITNIINLKNKEDYKIIYQNNFDNKENIQKITISEFINIIYKRITIFIPIIYEQIQNLIKGINIFESSYSNKIDVFEEISQKIFYEKMNNKIKTLNYTFFDIDDNGNLVKIIKKENMKKYKSNEARYFKLKVKSENFILESFIEFGFDFPKKIPYFNINLLETENQKEKIPKALQNLISNDYEINSIKNKFINIEKEIEKEINDIVKYDNVNEINIFKIQLEKILYCIQILNQIKITNKKIIENICKGKTKFKNILNEKNEILFPK
jgi:hypothetical protein